MEVDVSADKLFLLHEEHFNPKKIILPKSSNFLEGTFENE